MLTSINKLLNKSLNKTLLNEEEYSGNPNIEAAKEYFKDTVENLKAMPKYYNDNLTRYVNQKKYATEKLDSLNDRPILQQSVFDRFREKGILPKSSDYKTVLQRGAEEHEDRRLEMLKQNEAARLQKRLENGSQQNEDRKLLSKLGPTQTQQIQAQKSAEEDDARRAELMRHREEAARKNNPGFYDNALNTVRNFYSDHKNVIDNTGIGLGAAALGGLGYLAYKKLKNRKKK